MVETPSGWQVRHIRETAAVIRNDQFELQVEINPRYSSSSRHRRGSGRTPISYTVQVVQDWFSKGVHGDLEVGTRTESWEEAVKLAETFMQEFNAERSRQSEQHIQAVHGSTRSTDDAEHLLNTEAAAEALTDGAGYSDDILLDTLAVATDDSHQFVAHRHASEVDIIYNPVEQEFSEQRIHELYAAFPVDKLAVDELFEETTPLTMATHLAEFTLYRFVYGIGQETDIVVQKCTQLDSPTFERAVEGVLEEKWS